MSITAKSVVFDCADNYGDTSFAGIRSIEFFLAGVKIELSTSDFTAYATTEYSANYSAAKAFDTSLSKVGTQDLTTWMTLTGEDTDQRLIVVFNTAQVFDEIVINNYHASGSATTRGMQHVKITTSTDAITSTVYDEAIANSTVLNDAVWDQHTAINEEDAHVVYTVEATGWSDINSAYTLSGGDKTATKNTDSYTNVRADRLLGAGKFYWEVVVQNIAGVLNVQLGTCERDTVIASQLGSAPGTYAYLTDGKKANWSSGIVYGDPYGEGDTIGCAVNLDTNSIWWSKNGVWQASGDPAAGTGAAYTNVTEEQVPAGMCYYIGDVFVLHADSDEMSYDIPTGFLPIGSEAALPPNLAVVGGLGLSGSVDAQTDRLITVDGSLGLSGDIDMAEPLLSTIEIGYDDGETSSGYFGLSGGVDVQTDRVIEVGWTDKGTIYPSELGLSGGVTVQTDRLIAVVGSMGLSGTSQIGDPLLITATGSFGLSGEVWHDYHREFLSIGGSLALTGSTEIKFSNNVIAGAFALSGGVSMENGVPVYIQGGFALSGGFDTVRINKDVSLGGFIGLQGNMRMISDIDHCTMPTHGPSRWT